MTERTGRILVVDDVRENVRLLQAVLEAHGYEVVSATDGEAALELVVSAEPDLVLLDVQMPQLDGYLSKPVDIADLVATVGRYGRSTTR